MRVNDYPKGIIFLWMDIKGNLIHCIMTGILHQNIHLAICLETGSMVYLPPGEVELKLMKITAYDWKTDAE